MLRETPPCWAFPPAALEEEIALARGGLPAAVASPDLPRSLPSGVSPRARGRRAFFCRSSGHRRTAAAKRGQRPRGHRRQQRRGQIHARRAARGGLWRQSLPYGRLFPAPRRKTAERLSQPGGNVDEERFQAEVLSHLANPFPPPWRCHEGALAAPVFVEPRAVEIVEAFTACIPTCAAPTTCACSSPLIPKRRWSASARAAARRCCSASSPNGYRAGKCLFRPSGRARVLPARLRRGCGGIPAPPIRPVVPCR